MPRYSPYGFGRFFLPFSIPLAPLNSTSAVVQALSLALGFRFVIEKGLYIATTAHAGASGSRTVNVRKGTASGTVVTTFNPTTAGLGTPGTVLTGTIVTSGSPPANDFGDSDTLTIEFASGGTAITAGTAEILLVCRALAQRAA